MGLVGYTVSEQDRIMERLERFQVIYVARPEGQRAVHELAHKGHVSYRRGEGPDAGLLLVRKSMLPPPRPQGPGECA